MRWFISSGSTTGRLHVVLIALCATFVALLIFLTAAMDNPFRGEFSVSPDAIKDVINSVMKPAK